MVEEEDRGIRSKAREEKSIGKRNGSSKIGISKIGIGKLRDSSGGRRRGKREIRGKTREEYRKSRKE